MSTAELAETLLNNGYYLKPSHRTEYVIAEVILRGCSGNPSPDYFADRDKTGSYPLDMTLMGDKLFYILYTLVIKCDWKYWKGFCYSIDKDDPRKAMLKIMDNLRTFLVSKCIPWRETTFLDIIEANKEPNGRMVRLGEMYAESTPNFWNEHPCGDCITCTKHREHILADLA